MRLRNGVDVDVVRVALEQRDVMGFDELAGDGPTHGPGPGDCDFHRASGSSLGGNAAMASASAMCPEMAAR